MLRLRHTGRCALALAALLCVAPGAARAQGFDVLIKGGHVLDGTGNPWFAADVGIRGGRVVAVGPLEGATARRVVDATGKIVTPGFIDLHSHADDPNYGPHGLRSSDPQRRSAPNLVMQGITTVVVNPDGRSPLPIAEQKGELERRPFGPNAILMVGHNSVRAAVLGRDFRRPSTPAEIERMRAMVHQGMEEGAWGLTAGLEYVPGRWSTTDEVVALVREITPYHGVYIAHERSEGADPMWYWPSQDAAGPPTLIDAVQETIEIGERTGATVVASHIKAKGAQYWGTGYVIVRLIDEARARGISVYADQYPYTTTGSDGGTVLIPDWVFRRNGRGGGAGPRDFRALLREALAVDSVASDVRRDIAHEIRRRGGAENIVVMEYPDSAAVGKSLAELARAHGVSPVDMAIRLQLEGSPDTPGGGGLRGFSLSDYDLEEYAAQPWTATATDGWITLPEDGFTHVRVYGTFPHKIAHYARDEGVLSVPDAVRSATSLPAQIMGIADRGLVKPGYAADLVVLDLEQLHDNATFFDPHQFPSGIDYVLINGEFVVEGGAPTGALPGRVLTRTASPAATTGS